MPPSGRTNNPIYKPARQTILTTVTGRNARHEASICVRGVDGDEVEKASSQALAVDLRVPVLRPVALLPDVRSDKLILVVGSFVEIEGVTLVQHIVDRHR